MRNAASLIQSFPLALHWAWLCVRLAMLSVLMADRGAPRAAWRRGLEAAVREELRRCTLHIKCLVFLAAASRIGLPAPAVRRLRRRPDGAPAGFRFRRRCPPGARLAALRHAIGRALIGAGQGLSPGKRLAALKRIVDDPEIFIARLIRRLAVMPQDGSILIAEPPALVSVSAIARQPQPADTS